MDSQTVQVLSLVAQAFFTFLLVIVGWIVRREVGRMDSCRAQIRRLMERELPALKERIKLLEHKVDMAEKDINNTEANVEQLMLRDVVREGKKAIE